MADWKTSAEKATTSKTKFFFVGSQQVYRKAGDKAGNHMLAWRKARDLRPELFSQLHV